MSSESVGAKAIKSKSVKSKSVKSEDSLEREIPEDFIIQNWFNPKELFGEFKDKGHIFYTAAVNPKCFKVIDSSIEKVQELNNEEINAVIELGVGAYPYVIRKADEIRLRQLLLVDLVKQVEVLPPDGYDFAFVEGDVNFDSTIEKIPNTFDFPIDLLFACELYTHIAPEDRKIALQKWGNLAKYIIVIDRCSPDFLREFEIQKNKVPKVDKILGKKLINSYLNEPKVLEQSDQLVDPRVIIDSCKETHRLNRLELLFFEMKGLVMGYFVSIMERRAVFRLGSGREARRSIYLLNYIL